MSRLILVSGAGASGKSEYAEKLAVDMHEDRLIYVATMRLRPNLRYLI